MNRLRLLSAAVASLLCFSTPVAFAAHGGQPAGPGSTAIIAAPAPGSPEDRDIPLCC